MLIRPASPSHRRCVLVVGRGDSWSQYDIDASVALSTQLVAALALALVVCFGAVASALLLCRRRREMQYGDKSTV